MKVSREQVAENRKKIVATASRLFRARGFEAVSVADIMNEVGLTHGGFYGYFKSKDELIAHALGETSSPWSGKNLSQIADTYLSPGHRDNPGTGCPTAALAADIARMTPAVRGAMTEVLQRQIDVMTKVAGSREQAIGLFAALVGGLTLARMTKDERLSDEILAATHAFVMERQ